MKKGGGAPLNLKSGINSFRAPFFFFFFMRFRRQPGKEILECGGDNGFSRDGKSVCVSLFSLFNSEFSGLGNKGEL